MPCYLLAQNRNCKVHFPPNSALKAVHHTLCNCTHKRLEWKGNCEKADLHESSLHRSLYWEVIKQCTLDASLSSRPLATASGLLCLSFSLSLSTSALISAFSISCRRAKLNVWHGASSIQLIFYHLGVAMEELQNNQVVSGQLSLMHFAGTDMHGMHDFLQARAPLLTAQR